MEIVSSFIQPLISCIGPDHLIRQFGYMIKAKDHVDELINLARNLEAKKKDIKEQLDAEERYGKHPTEEVRRWIEKVEVKVTKVHSDYNQIEGRCWPNCWSSYKIGRSASKLRINLVALENERAGFGVLVTNARPTSVQPMSSTSILVGNMINLNKEKICGYLGEEADGVIGIWGMGGVGKTTLLEAINDNFLDNNNGNSATNKLFDHVIFIVVSKEHQLENLQKMIVEKLGLPSGKDFVSQAGIISDFLKEKNFLLLLDDIWNVVQLRDLGIPFPRSSSSGRKFRGKVVFTTRSLLICKGMDCHERNIIKVDCLEPEAAWNLFKEKVGENILNLPGIMSRAKKVIKKCGGLPLVLVVIGRAMAMKESPQEWDYALTQLEKSQPTNISDIEDYFPQLKLSYDSLRDDKMRECFLCCSLWPEDFEIRKEELIMCWMGLGLIDDFEDINEAYDKGYDLIGSLTNASLLERVREKDNVIKVHDAIRDLALWIARDNETNKNKWLVKARSGLEEVPNEMVKKWEEAERISLMENRIKELPHDLPLCHNLSTLLLQGNYELVGIPGGVFTYMPKLTYLDLSRTDLKEIPKEIRHLVQLIHLNLSFTNISTLPEEFGELMNLKYLLLRGTEVGGEVIRRIIGRLEKLEYLDLYPSCVFAETDELLRLPRSLKAVGMKITSEHALQQLFRVPILYLNIEDMSSTTSIIHLRHLLSSRTQRSLRELRFDGCHGIRELDVVRLPRLESLVLSELEILTEIAWCSVLPPSKCFERLRRLKISGCHGLKDITWVLHLPCLEELDVDRCSEMEQLVVIGGGGELEVTKPPTFPRLRRLYLFHLPKLAMICDNQTTAADDAAVNFPSLELLHVYDLPKLAKICDNHAAAAVSFPSLERLDVQKCNGMKDITWVLHLPCLEKLLVDRCYEMEQLVVIGGGGDQVTKPTFPRLTRLTLLYLPKLVMICDNQATAAAVNFPSLELLYVHKCNGLKKLPFHPQQLPLNNNNNCSRLKHIRGEREWWDGIEWEDQSAQSSLQPYFQDSPIPDFSDLLALGF